MAPKVLGYSFWGFLGVGITDTPDGGRSHRAHLIQTMLGNDFQVVMLQADRDTLEAQQPIALGQTYHDGFPKLDGLFLEWRWRIPPRNTDPTRSGYTPDWHRQEALIRHYAGRCPIVIWDKDQTLSQTAGPLRQTLQQAHTVVFEPSLYPSEPTRLSALFPFNCGVFTPAYRATWRPPADRPHTMIYIGNDYQRRGHFRQYLQPLAHRMPVQVYGKWPEPMPAAHLTYHGRVGYAEVNGLYRQAVATFLLAPPRYQRSGQFTQRLYECLLGGCLPLGPATYRGIHTVLEPELIVQEPRQIAERVEWLQGLTVSYQELMSRQLARLSPFSAHQLVQDITAALAGQRPRWHPSSPSEGRLPDGP